MATTTQNGIARETWRREVSAAATQAREKYRAQEDTIDLAEQICLAGDLHWQEDGTATVASQHNPSTSYTVKGDKCTCQQAMFRPHEPCKHVFATWLYRKAYDATKAQVDAATTPAKAEASASALLPEAPASANCYIAINGRQVQLTLRDADETRLLQRVRTVLQQFPPPPKDRQAAPEAETPDHFCPIHRVQMRLYTKDDHSWYSHRNGESWCNGKAKANASQAAPHDAEDDIPF
jgi:hypothetical protein